MGPPALFRLRTKSYYGFLSPLKIYRSRSGSEHANLGSNGKQHNHYTTDNDNEHLINMNVIFREKYIITTSCKKLYSHGNLKQKIKFRNAVHSATTFDDNCGTYAVSYCITSMNASKFWDIYFEIIELIYLLRIARRLYQILCKCIKELTSSHRGFRNLIKKLPVWGSHVARRKGLYLHRIT
jgi:hypothetical protein